MMSVIKISSLVLLITSTILIVISLATDYWLSGTGGNLGLWTVCYPTLGCFTLGSGADVDSTRAFIIISMLLLLGAIGCQAREIHVHSESTNVNIQKLTSIIAFVAGTSAVIAMAVFTGTSGAPTTLMTFSWSYGLGWASAALSLIAGLVAFFAFKNGAQ